MKLTRTLGLGLLAVFLTSLSIGVSFGDVAETETRDFILKDYRSLENKSFSDVISAKVNIMAVTETTCSSCIKELRSLEWLRDRYGDDLSVTAVFIDRVGWSRVSMYLDHYDFDIDLALIDAGGLVPARFGVSYIPSLIMFDRDGNEVYRKQGFAEGEESLISAKIDEVLSGRKRRRAVTPAGDGGSAPVVRKTTGCAGAG